MTIDEIHRAFHQLFAGNIADAETVVALFAAADAAGYQHACTRNCPKGPNHA